MIISTKFFQNIEIEDNDIIDFDEGLPGFENVKRFVVINIKDNKLLKCLQSVDNKEVSFIAINPWDVFKDYNINIEDKELSLIGGTNIDDLKVFSLLTITQKGITANLLGPIIVNTAERKGKQFVQYNSKYTTRHTLTDFRVEV